MGKSLECSRAELLPLCKGEQVQQKLLLLNPNLQMPREAGNYNSYQNEAFSILLCTANEAN